MLSEHADLSDVVMPFEQAALPEAVMPGEHADIANAMACENADFEAVLPSKNANFPCCNAMWTSSFGQHVTGVDTSNDLEANSVRSPEHANLANEEKILLIQTSTDEKTISEPSQVDNSNPSPEALLLNEAPTQTDVLETDDLSQGPSPSSAYWISA